MNRPQITILCEDKQHESFIRRFLKKRNRKIYAVPRSGVGAGDQFVRDNYPAQLDAVRKRGGILVAMIDGDNYSIEQRQKQMDKACEQRGVSPRKPSDKVAVFVPMRNIETWFAYLNGERVNETDTYPRLERERECRRHVNVLEQMCAEGRLRTPAPASLEDACREYETSFDSLGVVAWKDR